MVSVIKSERGKDVPVDELQYMYHQNGTNKCGSVVYWECAERKFKGCKARLRANSGSNSFEYIKKENEYIHLSGKDKVEAKKAQQASKDKEASFHQWNCALVSECVTVVDDFALSKWQFLVLWVEIVGTGDEEYVFFPSLPSGGYGYNIPLQFQSHASGAWFLQYDSEVNDGNKILISALDERLDNLKVQELDSRWDFQGLSWNLLCNSHHSHTNQTKPRLRIELFMTKLKNLLVMITSMTSDFEAPSIRAVKHVVFLSVTYNGCFFHFCQALYRITVDMGASHVCHNNKDFSL